MMRGVIAADTTRALACYEAEERLGRKLTPGERAIDIKAMTAALEEGKAKLAEVIEREKNAQVARFVAGRRPRLEVTAEMKTVLVDLRDEGERLARAELAELGVTVREFADRPDREWRWDSWRSILGSLLRALATRIDKEGRGVLEVGGDEARSAILRRIEGRVPGALDAASRLVSGALSDGVALTYEAHEDLFPGWVYSAVLDGGTCQPCRSKDGTEYDTLEEAYRDLPNFGPNPLCLGDGRCRCRLVPRPPEEAEPEVPPEIAEVAAGGWSTDPRWEKETRVSEVVKDGSGRPLLSRSIQEVISGIDEVIRPRHRRRRLKEVMITGTNDRDNLGGYLYVNLSGDPYGIELTTIPPTSWEESLAHEIGHYLDHQILGRRSSFGSELFLDGEGPYVEELGDFFRVAANSSSIQRLMMLKSDPVRAGLPDYYEPDRRHLAYLLEPKEIFARAFAQWIAERTQNENMMTQVGRRSPATGLVYPGAWDWDEDWPAVRDAMTELFDRLGWLP